MQEKITDLKPKRYRALQALGAEWYRQIYHTKYQIPKADYLKHMYETAVGDTRAKETNKARGLPDPNSVTSVTGQGQKRTADTASSQPQAKAKRGTSAPGTYATAVTGKADGQSHPIGGQTGKSTPAKVPAKYGSGAIGAPVPAQNPPKAPTEMTAIGAPAKQPATQQSTSDITSDSVLQYLADSKGTEF